MRSELVGILLFLSLSADAREPCDADHQEYLVRKSVEYELSEPGPDAPLVALSTEHGFVVLAEQSKFIPIADYRENRQTGLGPYDFYWWLRSRQPTDLIDLNSFSGTYSHMYFHMMKLVESGDVYVRPTSRIAHLEEAHLEWYACNNERGGRRLRTESGQTIIWIPDWIA
jgi:hypothetical protein